MYINFLRFYTSLCFKYYYIVRRENQLLQSGGKMSQIKWFEYFLFEVWKLWVGAFRILLLEVTRWRELWHLKYIKSLGWKLPWRSPGRIFYTSLVLCTSENYESQ